MPFLENPKDHVQNSVLETVIDEYFSPDEMPAPTSSNFWMHAAAFLPNFARRLFADALMPNPAIAHLVVTELTLDDSKRMLYLGTHTGPELLHLLRYRAPRRVLLLPALARAHGHVPIHIRGRRSFAGTLVTSISKDYFLLAVQQAVSLGHIINIDRRADDGMHQARFCVHTNVRLHAEVPLVALLDLVHLGVALTSTVLSGARCRNQGSVHHCAALEQQTIGDQLGVDDLQNLQAQLVLLKQMSKRRVLTLSGMRWGDADVHEATVEIGLKQSFFGSHVGQAKPQLQAVHTQPSLPDQTAGARSWPAVCAARLPPPVHPKA